MTQFEKAEISRLPKKYNPMGAWSYFWYTVLFSIPVLGLISLIVCSCSDKNINRRSFSRGYLIGVIVVALIAILVAVAAVVLVLGGFLPEETMEMINDTLGQFGFELVV